MRHDWYRDELGGVDSLAFDVDPNEYSVFGHNGPMCRRCGAHFCEHCEAGHTAALLNATDCEGDE